MNKTVLAVFAALPLAVSAQGPKPQAPAQPPPQSQARPAPRPGSGPGAMPGMSDEARAQRAALREQRARMARVLGLAEILGLNEQQALKLRDQLAQYDERRTRATEQLRTAHETLRRAAGFGGPAAPDANGKAAAPVSSAEVDQAIQRMFAARAELEAIERDSVATVTKDLPADRRARAALFLQRFSHRFGAGPMVRVERRMEMPGPGRMMNGPGMRMRMGMNDGAFGEDDEDLPEPEVGELP